MSISTITILVYYFILVFSYHNITLILVDVGMDVEANENALRWFCAYWAITSQQNYMVNYNISTDIFGKDEL